MLCIPCKRKWLPRNQTKRSWITRVDSLPAEKWVLHQTFKKDTCQEQKYSWHLIRSGPEPTCPSSVDWIHKLWSSHRIKYSPATRVNEPRHSTIEVNFTYIILRQRNTKQKVQSDAIYCVNPNQVTCIYVRCGVKTLWPLRGGSSRKTTACLLFCFFMQICTFCESSLTCIVHLFCEHCSEHMLYFNQPFTLPPSMIRGQVSPGVKW